MASIPASFLQNIDKLASPDHATGSRLRLENVVKTYFSDEQPVHALNGVSLTLERGDLAIVLGPTGSGKTTLLRAAAGLLPASAGSVTADGRPVDGRRYRAGSRFDTRSRLDGRRRAHLLPLAFAAPEVLQSMCLLG